MGELHLEILVDRMLREFKVEANIGAPQVSYRETIRSSSKGEGKYARQTGGKGQYGHVIIEMEPAEVGKGFEFVNKIVGGPTNNFVNKFKTFTNFCRFHFNNYMTILTFTPSLSCIFTFTFRTRPNSFSI